MFAGKRCARAEPKRSKGDDKGEKGGGTDSKKKRKKVKKSESDREGGEDEEEDEDEEAEEEETDVNNSGEGGGQLRPGSKRRSNPKTLSGQATKQKLEMAMRVFDNAMHIAKHNLKEVKPFKAKVTTKAPLPFPIVRNKIADVGYLEDAKKKALDRLKSDPLIHYSDLDQFLRKQATSLADVDETLEYP
ncbi:hypothetical protein LTR91_002899 [Friedmanniomyces endolithicus]|uniref:Uncharacterized protein n=1 Tax=Friedmanniomyces endolithicus TaxID=329885 RepID=A0AAN6KYI2_9PEZI|nr:hypothetical protein LTR57_004554 [Friedmanniomyces endolithicus]KAK1009249.1 hypothetical protein LTR91_002899 [Friedmanniomyces endolithicus]